MGVIRVTGSREDFVPPSPRKIKDRTLKIEGCGTQNRRGACVCVTRLGE
jgi:hypothetical protein